LKSLPYNTVWTSVLSGERLKR